MDIYVLKKNLDITTLTLQPTEVVDAKWVSKDELLSMIDSKEIVWSVGLRYTQYNGLIS